MFASNLAIATAPIKFAVVGTGTPVQHVLPGHPPAPEAAARSIWRTEEQTIKLRCPDDEPALEYGCVDWFLYDEQRPQ